MTCMSYSKDFPQGWRRVLVFCCAWKLWLLLCFQSVLIKGFARCAIIGYLYTSPHPFFFFNGIHGQLKGGPMTERNKMRVAEWKKKCDARALFPLLVVALTFSGCSGGAKILWLLFLWIYIRGRFASHGDEPASPGISQTLKGQLINGRDAALPGE